MSKTPFIAAAVLAAGLACGSAQARDVYWSVGINAPLQGVGQIGTVVGNYPGRAGVYQPAYQPVFQPVYQPQYQPQYQRDYQQDYQPSYQSDYQPVYRPVYQPVYRPARVVYYPAYGYRHHPHWDRRDHRRDHRREERRDEWREDWREHHHRHGR